LLAETVYPESDRVPAGEPFGSSVALPAISDAQSDDGIGGLVQWAPHNGLVLELGTTPTSFDVSNFVGALRLRFESDGGSRIVGADRSSVEDSLLSYAGTHDPVDGRTWGGVVRNRAYFGGRIGDDDFNVYGLVAGAILDGERVDDNTEWRGDAGFLKRGASGNGWVARFGGALELQGFAANRSHFTTGHGGYFSPDRFLSVGPIFELQGRREERSFRLEGGIAWQAVREESTNFFPTDAALQAAGGDPRYPGDSRDGIGYRLAASMGGVSGSRGCGHPARGRAARDADECACRSMHAAVTV
jgi:hypothetical protein